MLFSVSKLSLICFFFIKRSNNLFTVKISNNIRPRHSFFNFFNYKIIFRPTLGVTICKNFFMFWYSLMITNFRFRIFLFIFFIKGNIYAWFFIDRLHFICARYVLLYLLSISCNLSIYIYAYIYILILTSYICKCYSLEF